MQTVVYLSGNTMQTVVGKGNAKRLHIKKMCEDRLDEGCLINGIVIDEEAFTARLKAVFEEHGLPRRRVTLAINSSELATKLLTLPSVGASRMPELVAREFAQTERVSDPVSDYRASGKQQHQAQLIAAMADRAFVEKYERIFSNAGIHVKRIVPALCEAVKLLGMISALERETCVVQLLDGNMLTCILLVDGVYAYSQRTRLYSEEGTNEFAGEIAGTFASMRQFYATLHHDTPLEKVYLGGVKGILFDECVSGLAQLSAKAEALPEDKRMRCSGGEYIRDFVYASGGCIALGKDINLLERAKYNEAESKKRTKLLLRILPVALTVALCVASAAMVLTKNMAISAQCRELEEYIQSEEVQAQKQKADECEAEISNLQNHIAAIQAAREAIDSYPLMNTKVLRAVQSCRTGTVTLKITEYDASEGRLLVSATAANANESNPLIAKLKKTGSFEDVQYVGYHFDEQTSLYEISIACYLNLMAGKEAAQ